MWIADLFNILDPYVSRDWLRQQLYYELFGVLAPFVLRIGLDKLTDLIWGAVDTFCGGDLREAIISGRGRRLEVPCRFCGKRQAEAEIELIAARDVVANEAGGEPAPGGRGVGQSDGHTTDAMVYFMTGYDDWEAARKRLGFDKRRLALVVSAVRVLLWHWLQPALYFVVFYAFSDLLNTAELYLGLLVAVRELFYFIMVLILIFRKPGAFLYSPSENRSYFNCLYVFCPEKLCASWLGGSGVGGSDCANCLTGLIVLLDICGIVSIILLVVNGQWYLPLMIGYGVTAISVLAIPVSACLFG